MRSYFIAALALLTLPQAWAAGPAKVATLDRQLWPQAIDSRSAFDQASAAEIRQFTRLLAATPLDDAAAVTAFTQVDNPDMASVQQWRELTQLRLQGNYAMACHQCQDAKSWEALVAASQQPHDNSLGAWQQASQAFHQRYLYEQVRLAALFGRVTSEVLPLGAGELDELERSGFNQADGHFLLSYDDGPSSTVKGDNRSAQLVSALEGKGLHAQFFALGERLAAVKPGKDFYANQCVGSHGYQHKSHQRWDGWAQSLADTRKLLAELPQKGHHWFRPPYGQRQPALLESLAERDEGVMLWNIDSQDWNRKLDNQQVQDRVITLMLLWRSGIILYHDIHPKALANLPALVDFQKQAGLTWTDCRDI
ncbi:polysaccharide deacetylase family protein [Gallaecimonas xiamenensis]|uniref:Polysaccharide deacetylase n=1 Tax=Gallaecimonas xiamenensis 3-C-1 TaxID=745411 RepID=K2JRS2_9GAMM|nr:polysaccharide deacetylase family protein [Gallaecimonas xiamenensis]EKE77172.1 polysaccharide deacetylase [Gallaecimonas xiamenensis 3-C-1]